MMQTTKTRRMALGSRQRFSRNQLLRYQAIIAEFNRHDVRYTPITVIWREFIYPKFFISRSTLYRILSKEAELEVS